MRRKTLTIVAIAALTALACGGDEQPAQTPLFAFPDVTARVAVYADRIEVSALTQEQLAFAATHFVGTQKITAAEAELLRELNPAFVVLHYHLGIWQQNPDHAFIIDGERWGNDFDQVTGHDDWFWVNEAGERVRSTNDGKYLMNISSPGMQDYWRTTILEQIAAGGYDGVFLDSSSPPLLTGECVGGDLDGEWMPGDERFRERGVLGPFAELGGVGWPEAYADFMGGLCAAIEEAGVACVPNVGNHITIWDPTDYFTTSTGGMVENVWMGATESDWVLVADRVLRMGDGVVILQSYLDDDSDVDQRLYYLGCYLLVKGRHGYVTYFADDPFVWFPEYELDLGAPTTSASGGDISTLAWSGVYRRDFERGLVLVNPTDREVPVDLGGERRRVVATGDGTIAADGTTSGELRFEPASSLVMPPWSAAIFR